MHWPAVVISLHVLGLILLGWALRGRVPPTGVRCPKCWYDMGSIASSDDAMLRCPECGRLASVEHWARVGAGWRSRGRRGKGVVAALLIQFGCGYYWYQRTPGYESWTGVMPDWALMEMVEHFPDETRVVSRSLAGRWDQGELSRAHVAELCQRFLASPPSVGLLPPIARRNWPVGQPVVIQMAKGPGGGMWFRFAGVDGQEFWAQGSDPMLAPPIAAGWGATGWADERGYYLRLPPARPGINTYSLMVEQQFHYDWAWNAGGVVWSQRFRPALSFQGVQSIDQCITPVDTPEIREHVREAVHVDVMPAKDDPFWGRMAVLSVRVNADVDAWQGKDCSTACRVRLECGGQVIASMQQGAHEFDIERYWNNCTWEVEIQSIPELAGRLSDDGRRFDFTGLTLRAIGDGELAIQELFYDKYWNGEITVDLADVARVKQWP